MAIQNHYIRKKLGNRQFVSSLQSVFYSEIPATKLVTKLDVINMIRESPEASKYFTNPSDIENMLEDMVKDGYIKEIIGVSLEKLVN